MSINIPLKEIANIGKSALVLAVGICENYKKEIFVEEVDYESCPDSCPIKGVSDKAKAEYCNDNCPNAPKKLPNVVYVNEKHRYKLRVVDLLEQKRLSKLQLLQFLLYHFLNVDSNGVIKYVSVKEVASVLGCTTRSVRNNNIVLSELGLIAFTKINIDLFSVAILRYKQYRETKENNGTGYIPIVKEFFQTLLEMENVNEIRLSIRQLIEFDDSSAKQDGSSCVYTYNDIKHFMPKNIGYKSVIDKTLDGTTKLFDVEKRASFVEFKLKDEFNGKVQKPIKEALFKKELDTFMVQNKLEDKQDSIKDLIQMSMEYGVQTVETALTEYISRYMKILDKPVENFGGFIRDLIKGSLYKKLVA